jgi:TonB family protein
VRLRRARQGWLPAQVARRDVYLSEGFGPAVFGFIAPQIVVPKWVRDAERDEQELIVLHESEHIRARDQWQLLLAICATIAMPWNPLVWIHTRRLRFAIEADCDQRVLAAAPDHARYASLLVNVGAKQNGLLLTPALAEHRNGLEARLNMLATKLKENRWKAAGMMAVGIVLTVVACESRLPQEATEDAFITKLDERPIAAGGPVVVDDRAVVSKVREGARLREAPKVTVEKILPTRMVPDKALRSLPRRIDPDGEPHFTPYTKKPEVRNRERVMDLLESNYPPALRDAGIGGTVLVWVLVDENGRVINKKLRQTSGQETLDVAGLQVIQQMEFIPAEHEGKPVRVWIQMPVVFRTQ